MEYQLHSNSEVQQTSMFKMIRSARSCLNWEQGMEGSASMFTDAGGSSEMRDPRNNSDGSVFYTEAAQQLSTERTLKRVSAAHVKCGSVGNQRLSRLRTRAISGENVAPSMAPASSAPTAVLGDVTNVMQYSANVPCGKQQQPAAKTKPESDQRPKQFTPSAAQQTGVVCTSMSPTPGDVDSDLANADDPQHCIEYLNDIFKNLRADESLHLPLPGYLDHQPQVNSKMRSILVDWLVDVHRKYKLCATTLFLAVSLIDRFLEKRTTQRKHLQLVGVTGLLIAAKYEEVYPPQINDFVYVTDKAYAKDDIIKMEVTMLSALDFTVCRPLAVTFLDRYEVVNGCAEAHQHLAHYLLELTLVDYKMAKYAPSHLAAAALLLSNKLLQRLPCWTPAVVKHTKMTEPMLKECAKEMCGLLENVEQSQLQAVRKKYSQLKFHAVAKLNFGSVPRTNSASSGGCDGGQLQTTNEPKPRSFAVGGC